MRYGSAFERGLSAGSLPQPPFAHICALHLVITNGFLPTTTNARIVPASQLVMRNNQGLMVAMISRQTQEKNALPMCHSDVACQPDVGAAVGRQSCAFTACDIFS